MKLTFNLHSHTYRCGHAKGSDEEFVLAAIQAGFKTMGFSDHVFLPGREEPFMRGKYEWLDEYCQSVRSLKEKYKDQITIYLGFECEYSPIHMDYYRRLLEEKKVDYLIQGQHCFYTDENIQIWYGKLPNQNEALTLYVNDCIKGMESGLFTYLAHPDFFILVQPFWNERSEKEFRRLIQAAIDHDIPLELNMGRQYHPERNTPGKTANFVYPFPPFWELVKEMGAKVVVGVDAHAPSHYLDGQYDWIESFVSYYGFDVSQMPRFPHIEKK